MFLATRRIAIQLDGLFGKGWIVMLIGGHCDGGWWTGMNYNIVLVWLPTIVGINYALATYVKYMPTSR
jgi:hypothetical protein